MSLKFKYSNLIIFLALYVPFEVIILKYLPVSDRVYSLLRFLPEVMIYLLLIVNIIHSTYHRHWISRTPIDVALLIFVLSAIISIIINEAPLSLSIIGMRPLLRYIALFYIVSNIDIPESKIKFLLIALIFVGGLQSVLTSYQHFAGIGKVFMPRATDLEVEGVQSQFKLVQTGWGSGREQGAGIGTFGDSVLVALFLVFIAVISLSFLLRMKIKAYLYRIILFGIFLISFVALFYTYSRASVLIGIIAVPIILFLEKKIKRLFFIGIMSLTLFAGVLFLSSNQSSTNEAYYNPKTKYTNPLDNITSIFSHKYVQNNMEHSRGWVMVEVGGQLIKSVNFFGYGPSGDESLGRMVKEDVTSRIPFQNLSIINDVYWVAMLSYYGFFGLIAFLFILWYIFKAALVVYKKSNMPIYTMIGLSMMVIIILALPYTFIIRTFAFRPFAFYFWLLAGLVAAEYRRIKSSPSKEPA
jgi:O-antigen ligase